MEGSVVAERYRLYQQLDEGSIVINAVRLPGVSIE